MIAVAEQLAAGLRYTRVDLYEHRKRIYFAEITHWRMGSTSSIHRSPIACSAISGGRTAQFRGDISPSSGPLSDCFELVNKVDGLGIRREVGRVYEACITTHHAPIDPRLWFPPPMRERMIR